MGYTFTLICHTQSPLGGRSDERFEDLQLFVQIELICIIKVLDYKLGTTK